MSNKVSTIYQYEACPFCWKVRALMDYKGIPYSTVEVHPLNKKEIAFSKDYKKVPILVDDEGKQVRESNDIMRHLELRYPDKPVFEKEDDRRSKEKKWMDWCDQSLVRALPPVIYQSLGKAIGAFDYITKCSKFSWVQQRVIKYAGAFVMTMVAKKSAKAQGIDEPQGHLKQLIDELGQGLNGDKFLGQGKPNAADLSIYGVLKAVEQLPAFDIIRKQPKVLRWYEGMGELVPLQS